MGAVVPVALAYNLTAVIHPAGRSRGRSGHGNGRKQSPDVDKPVQATVRPLIDCQISPEELIAVGLRADGAGKIERLEVLNDCVRHTCG